MQHNLPTLFQEVIHKSRYARFNEETGQRESWRQTVERYCDFFKKHLESKYDLSVGNIDDPETPIGKAFYNIATLRVMPSMRCLMAAGPALEKENFFGYNCGYRAVDDIRAFDEILYIAMCTCGVGFSVERQFIGRLPQVPKRLKPSLNTVIVEDSRRGWAEAYARLIAGLYSGEILNWDVSKVRPKGARLKTTGGYASGPEPLVELFLFTIEVFKQAVGGRLNSLQCHDLICKMGEAIVVGGVRRMALISLSNPSDLRMRDAKSGDWYSTTRWRQVSNNSAVYTEKPSVKVFMEEWLALYASKSGERGIINRQAFQEKAASIGRRTAWDHHLGQHSEDLIEFGSNPCVEIILRSQQMCNLSEAVVRPSDSIDDLRDKVGVASMLGTWQATLTDFGYVTEGWKENCDEERLLGVSATGIMDNAMLAHRMHPDFLLAWDVMRKKAHTENKNWADILGINSAGATTCVKPSGTVSSLVNSASGVHARFAPHYIRRITMSKSDPMCAFMEDQGIPCESSLDNDANMLFQFPIRAPKGAETVDSSDRSAIEQLEHWKAVNDAWADHSVSCTVMVGENEWPEVGAWVWNNFDKISGVSFFPKTNSVYRQTPIEPCSEEQLRELEVKMPKTIDWNLLSRYEQGDETTVGQELACAGGACEVV